MGVASAFTLYAVGSTPGLIDQIVDQDLDAGVDEIVMGSDGSVYPTFAAVPSARPLGSFTTTAISTALTAIGVEGYGNADAAVTLFYQALLNYGTRGGSSLHTKATIAGALILPRTLSADQGAAARLACDIIPISSDGSTMPIAWTVDQTLAGAPTADELYTVGACSLNGSDVDGVQSVNIDFGIQEILLAGKGLPYASFGAKMRIAPTIRIRSLNMELMNSFKTPGLAVAGVTNATIRQIVQGGVGNGVTKTFTVAEGRITAVRGPATQDGEATCELMVTVTDNGSNDPIALS